MLRTVVRGVLKYLSFRRANQEGETLGRLVNLAECRHRKRGHPFMANLAESDFSRPDAPTSG